ncbi:MAG: MltA domain-containing protein [Pseudomonadota bacterium]
MGGIDRRTLLGALACAAVGRGSHAVEVTPLSFQKLEGWEDDDHSAALEVWVRSCAETGLGLMCDLPIRDARWFFETHFTPVMIGDPNAALFTGYYEPVIRASRAPDARWHVPLYAPPKDLRSRRPHYTRAQVERGALTGKGLELYWLSDPVDAYFLQIQGSGRLLLPDGELVRLGFGGKNGHKYVSIGSIFNRRRKAEPGRYRAASLKRWLRANPRDGAALMRKNPSFIYFIERTNLAPNHGPVGAIGVPLTTGRSIAVDPTVTQLGAPIWVETMASDGPIRRLMVAQDTGSAIKGHQRGDLFFGTGDYAGELAGSMRAGGRMISLIPNDQFARFGSKE